MNAQLSIAKSASLSSCGRPDSEDCDKISSLESRYALESKSYDEWSHLWLENTAYQNLRQKWPIGWVLETNRNDIVGYLGNIPRSYNFQGRIVTTAVTHAWVVDALYRSYSILLLDRYFNQSNVDLHLSTTVNAQASEAFRSFGSSPVPTGAWDRSLFWITNYHGFTTSWAAIKGLNVGRPLRYALSVALAAKNLSVKRLLNANVDYRDLEYSRSFDDRFDAFWHTLKEKHPQVLLAERSRQALEWHFKYVMLQKNLWVLTTRKGTGIGSYSIFCRQDNPRIGLKRMRLVDFQTVEGNTQVLLSMVSWALKRCREEGIHMLECIGLSREAETILGSLAPQNRQLPCWPYYYKSKDQALTQGLTTPEAWQPTPFDGDSSL